MKLDYYRTILELYSKLLKARLEKILKENDIIVEEVDE